MLERLGTPEKLVKAERTWIDRVWVRSQAPSEEEGQAAAAAPTGPLTRSLTPRRRPDVGSLPPKSSPAVHSSPGRAFISYVREDSRHVDQLQRTLEAAGVSVWRDTADLWPDEDWRTKIRRAITDDALVCSVARRRRKSASKQVKPGRLADASGLCGVAVVTGTTD